MSSSPESRSPSSPGKADELLLLGECRPLAFAPFGSAAAGLRHNRGPQAARGCALLLAFSLCQVYGALASIDSVYQVSRYELRGNTALEPQAARDLFTNAVGPAVPLSLICRSVARLRQAYQERGYDQVIVSLPEQELTNGVVFIDVQEGAPRALAAAKTNRTSPPTFEVRRFNVVGNTLLPQEEIEQIVNPAAGQKVTLEEIRKAAAALQRAYRERGYATVAVSVPSQRLTNATVRLDVTEGRLASIQVFGNRYFSSNNVARSLPSLKTNQLLNSHILQGELDRANKNRDRQIYPTIGPGPDAGTSALALRVRDRMPLHARLELDNYATPHTPDLRVNSAVQYNNLWQQEHQLGLAYAFTPQRMKSVGTEPNYGFNQPQISTYSAFYRMPIGGPPSISDQIAGVPNFGYQEATHQFLLPPAQARSEFLLYASASASDTGIQWGPRAALSTTNKYVPSYSQDSGQNLAANQNIGAQYRFPLSSGRQSSWNGFVGIDYKRSALSGFNTNNFYMATISSDNLGFHTNFIDSPQAQPATNAQVVYFPFSAGMDFTEQDAGGSTAMEITLAENLAGSSADFTRLAYSDRAKSAYLKASLAASRDQKLPAGCSLLARGGAQAASTALIGNEQFALGGINSVRGYYEGDQYGDSGWSGTLELRSPAFGAPVAALSSSVPAWVRASVFTDAGQRFLLESSPGAPSTQWLWGAGFGLFANINNHLDAGLTVAWPLLGTANTRRGEPHAYFTLGGQF